MNDKPNYSSYEMHSSSSGTKSPRGSLRMQQHQQHDTTTTSLSSQHGLVDSQFIFEQINLGVETKRSKQLAQEEANERMRVARKFARPVELILSVCGGGRHADLRAMLGFGPNEQLDEIGLKKAYRSVSLSIHPGEWMNFCFHVEVMQRVLVV